MKGKESNGCVAYAANTRKRERIYNELVVVHIDISPAE